MALAAAPFAAQAETWNIYGWQNYSWEFVDEKNSGRSYDRISGNAANIGFSANVDTGMNGIHVTLQCESWTLHNHWDGQGGWCTRNSKIGLSHPQMGEIMFATWLLPYNEGVAQWIDPFYDAGGDSHTSIMGSVGGSTWYHSPGDWNNRSDPDRHPDYATGVDTGFNRRQQEIIQYWSPNWNGFVFRFAWTAGYEDEQPWGRNNAKLDPVIRSSSLAYTNGPLWLAVAWQDHEDWTASRQKIRGKMDGSDAESLRVAGRYIMDMGDGMSVQISAMWETLEYEFNGVTSVDEVMGAFYLGSFTSTYDLYHDGSKIVGTPAVPGTPAMQAEVDENDVKAQKTLDLVRKLFYNPDATSEAAPYTLKTGVEGTAWGDVTTLLAAAGFAPADDPLTAADESKAAGSCAATTPSTCTDLNLNVLADTDTATAGQQNVLKAAIEALNNARDTVPDDNNDATTEDAGIQPPNLDVAVGQTGAGTVAQRNAQAQYDLLVEMATAAAEKKAGMTEAVPAKPAVSAAANRAAMTMGENVKIERDAWMVSGKIKFGGPIDFRFSYMDADDLEVSCASCSGDWDETAADAFNVGIFYTMPAGTELRLTYSEVNNDDNGAYGQGVTGTGIASPGNEIEMFAVGIVHWFD